MFIRLCVDIDQHGNVKGSSAELHDRDGLVTFVTDTVSPFDHPEEAFASLLAGQSALFGQQLELF